MTRWSPRSFFPSLLVIPILAALGCQAKHPVAVPTMAEAPHLYAGAMARQASRDELAHLALRRRMSPAERHADEVRQAQEREQREQARLAAIDAVQREQVARNQEHYEAQRQQDEEKRQAIWRRTLEKMHRLKTSPPPESTPPSSQEPLGTLLLKGCEEFGKAFAKVAMYRLQGIDRVTMERALRSMPKSDIPANHTALTLLLIQRAYAWTFTTSHEAYDLFVTDCVMDPQPWIAVSQPSSLRY